MLAFGRRAGFAFAGALALGANPFACSASAESAAYCAVGAGPRDAVQVPQELEADVAKTFNITVDMARQAAQVRCVGTKLLACWIGANLNCGKVDTRRSLPGATAFCRANPDAGNVPMFATGHATIYAWRCVGTRAVAGKTLIAVDAQGYAAANWKELP
jgi:hypothetical protein